MNIIIKNGFACKAPSVIIIEKNAQLDCTKSCQEKRAPFTLGPTDVWTINVDPDQTSDNKFYWVLYSEEISDLVSIKPEEAKIPPPIQHGNNEMIIIKPGPPGWDVIIKFKKDTHTATGSGNVTVGDDNQVPHSFKKILKELGIYK